MADENMEGLEGLDEFGDDFGDQLDAFMEGEEEEGDSELDSFFEDLSTIDDLEMQDEGAGITEPAEEPSWEEVPEAAPPVAAPAAADEETDSAEKKTEKKKKEKPKKVKSRIEGSSILIPGIITSVAGMLLGVITVAVLYFLNLPEGAPLPVDIVVEEPIPEPTVTVVREPEPTPKPKPAPKPKPKPAKKPKQTRYYVQVANCVFAECVSDHRNLLKRYGYKSRVTKSSMTSSMAEVISNKILAEESSIKLMNKINREINYSGKAFRKAENGGYRISLGMYPDLETAGRVRNHLNQSYGKQTFFEITRSDDKITYQRVHAGGYRSRKQAKSLLKLLVRKDKRFEGAFIVPLKR